MSDNVQVALIVAVVPTVASIVNTWLTQKVHKATNSMKDELVRMARREGHAAGMEEQKALDQPKS